MGSRQTNERLLHEGGVCRVLARSYPAGFRSSWVIWRLPAPTLNPNTPFHSSCFFCPLLPPPTPSSVYPAAGVWKWTGASNDVIPITPMCGLQRDMLSRLSTRSWTSSMPSQFDGLDSVNVGVTFSINCAEIGGYLSQLEDWVRFQVTMWGGGLRARIC